MGTPATEDRRTGSQGSLGPSTIKSVAQKATIIKIIEMKRVRRPSITFSAKIPGNQHDHIGMSGEPQN